MGDAVVVRRRRGQAFDAPLGRDAGRRRVDGDCGIVIHPQHATRIDRRAITAHEATGGRRPIPARNLAKREAADARGRVIADRRTEETGRRTAKASIAAEHQDLRSGLVDDRERKTFAVLGGDHPTGELDHRLGHVLFGRKQVDGRDGGCGALFGAHHIAARESQRQQQCATGAPDRRVHEHADGTVPRNEKWAKQENR